MHSPHDPYVRVRGAREHNLKGVDVDIPRDVLTVFTGVSGSGKSSLAFGTIYAEAQRRYFESVAPYARRLIHQVGAPKVGEISGLPPAVSLQQRRSAPTSRSSVGTVTNLSNSLRMLFSRAGDHPPGAGRLDSDAFSPNTAAGACPECHGLGQVHRTTEKLLVPDPSLSIRQGAIATWPGAWQGKNLRDILDALGHDVDRPWRELPAAQREWIGWTRTPDFLYRAVKNDRDGEPLAARLDATDSMGHLLELLFAPDRRPRPYNKYLRWDLARRPLPGWDGAALLRDLDRISASGDVAVQRWLFARVEAAARRAGDGAVLDGRGEDLRLMRPR